MKPECSGKKKRMLCVSSVICLFPTKKGHTDFTSAEW